MSFHVLFFVFVYSVSTMAQRQRVVVISLRNVVLVILEHERERNQLEKDLKKMQCTRLLARPWALKNKDIMRELITAEQPNMFEGTIQDLPEE